MNILGYTISTVLPILPVKTKTVINTINPHSYCVAQKDKIFNEALRSSDFLLPDGIGIVMAAKLLKKKKIEKIAGYDLFLNLMNQLNKINGTCFFLGSSPDTLVKIKKRAKREYPNVKIYYYSPPFKPIFSKEDSHKMCDEIKSISPDVLFVGMTAPKQEKWVHQHKGELDAQIICSIGAVFDFYAGTVKRAPTWIINIGMEWLHRSLKNPSRLGVRNIKSNPKFVWEIIKIKIKD